LKLSNPAAQTASGGELEFNRIAEGDAVATGRGKFARVIASDGGEVYWCDVGDEKSDAVIKLNPVAARRCASIHSGCRCRERALAVRSRNSTRHKEILSVT
jgi:hypothetical protein